MGFLSGLISLIVTVAWALVPFAVLLIAFAVFGVRSRLDAVFTQLYDTTKSINALRSDMRTSADRVLSEPAGPADS